MAELKRDTVNSIPSAGADVDLEMGSAAGAAAKASDDVLNGATWYGESAAELIQIIRDDGDMAEASRFVTWSLDAKT